jgi:two-component system cell cycle sensor histidine kinase/response regulator CckA
VLDLASTAHDAARLGHVTIVTGDAYIDATYSREHLSLPPGHYVVLVVSGSTSTPESLVAPDWQSERYVTPESLGRPDATALATVYRITKQSGGHLVIRRDAASGPTFKVYLPRETRGESRGTVLLVEDEPIVRRVTRELLEQLEYEVLEAADPHEAIWLAARYREPIDLLLADVVLPDMTGAMMAERLVESTHVSNVVYMSGLPKALLVSRGVIDDEAMFIEKPFTSEELASMIDQVLVSGRQ